MTHPSTHHLQGRADARRGSRRLSTWPQQPAHGEGILLHEWIEPTGGAEQVLDQFHEVFPDAPIATLWSDAPQRYTVPVHESWLARTSLRRQKQRAVPFMSSTWRGLDLSHFDWALISSYVFAHHAAHGLRRPDQAFVYLHTPARFLWAPEVETRGASRAIRTASPVFRLLDSRRLQRGAHLSCNSQFVASRVERAWHHEARVLYPPVETARIGSVENWADHLSPEDAAILDTLPDSFLLAASRLVPYKAIDKAIEVAHHAGLPLVVAGDGPDRPRLEALAEASPAPVRFLGRVSDALLYALYPRAVSYLFLAIEDFGIMPVEAMAAGGRVVTARTGGAAESVEHGRSGAHCDPLDLQSILDAVALALSINASAAVERAKQFDSARFRNEISHWIHSERQ